MSIPRVFPSREARAEIPQALQRFRRDGAMAEPVVFGAHRRPEAVVIPFELYTALLPAIEELRIAASEQKHQGMQAPPTRELEVRPKDEKAD